MRLSLLYNPFDLIERLAVATHRRRRLRKLRGTPAARLELGHIDSLELLEQLASDPPAVIYDIGANVGTWTVLAKSLFPAARIEAFEPLAMHADAFRRWTAPWPDGIRLHATALGAQRSRLEMGVADFSDASSFLTMTSEASAELSIRTVRRESMEIVPLDDYRKERDLPPPDLIKLDVQGYELEVLRGGERCLAHARAVICEVSFREYYQSQPLFHDVTSFLGERGLRLHTVAATTPVGAPLGQTDALYLRGR